MVTNGNPPVARPNDCAVSVRANVSVIGKNNPSRVLSLILLSAVWLFLAANLPSNAQSAAPTESEVKAAFLYNFAKFVEWPADSPVHNRDTITIAVLGDGSFEDVLERTVADKVVHGRRVSVRRISNIKEALDCQIVFVSASEERKLREDVKMLQGKSILTVGETEQFARRGGIISFRLEANQRRLDINPHAAEAARPPRSSHPAKLGRTLTERANPPTYPPGWICESTRAPHWWAQDSWSSISSHCGSPWCRPS